MRWGSHGRLNLIGALAWGKEKRTLHFELVEESVKSEHVLPSSTNSPVTLAETN